MPRVPKVELFISTIGSLSTLAHYRHLFVSKINFSKDESYKIFNYPPRVYIKPLMK